MNKKNIIIIILFFSVNIFAEKIPVDFSAQVELGIIPSIGGNLYSTEQENLLDANSGIENINRTKTGIKTSQVEPLYGVSGTIGINGIFKDHYIAHLGLGYSKSVYGGTGKTIDSTDDIYKVSYSLSILEVPFTLGLRIPYWKDSAISLTGGIAFTYGIYNNSFKSSTVNQHGEFKGYAFPIVVILSGEYFFTDNVALLTSLTSYHGSTEFIESNGDYAKIDFSGIRCSMGVSIYLGKMPVPKKVQTRVAR